MKSMIERQRFASVDGVYVEMADYAARWPDRKPDRTWSSFCVFIPDVQPIDIKSRITGRYVDVLPCVKPYGVWLMAGYCWLEKALIEWEEAKAQA